jgi:hypothetical protein
MSQTDISRDDGNDTDETFDTAKNGNPARETPGETSMGDGAGLELADPRDLFFLGRDEDGEPEPVPQKVPGREVAVEVVPAPEARISEYLNPVDWDDNEALAELFEKSFPALESVTAEDVANDALGFAPQAMVEVIRNASGKDMADAITDPDEEMIKELLASGNVTLEDINRMAEEQAEDSRS